MTSTTPKSSRFQIMRQIIRNRMDSRAVVSTSSTKVLVAPTKAKISNVKRNINNTTDGFSEGVFFNVPLTSSMVSSDSSVTSRSSSSTGGSVRSLSEYTNSAATATATATTTTKTNNTASPPASWKSTERKSFLMHQPLMVCDPEKEVDSELASDPVAALGKVMARSKKLPSTDYYCNNHIMVNTERVKHMTAPLSRLRELDDLARYHATAMAKSQKLYHCDPTMITCAFQRPMRRMGENVACGKNIRDIHTNMMTTPQQCSDKYNILHRCYTHMGMGTAKGEDGQLYLCQIFRG